MAQHILAGGIRAYRWAISPSLRLLCGPLAQCRYTPSCSAYALAAVSSHGALGGSWLTVKRIARCHPWGGCGCDPVPEPPAPALKVTAATAPGNLHGS